MTLRFPNASRSYDRSKRCISFWGHDSTLEITFHLDEAVLRRSGLDQQEDEAGTLRIFDVNRAQIERTAASIYSRQRKSFHHLSTADFKHDQLRVAD